MIFGDIFLGRGENDEKSNRNNDHENDEKDEDQDNLARAPPQTRRLIKKPSSSNRFEFLDGYRGSLAFLVALAHAKGSLNCLFLEALANLSQRYCIAGFFLLSSFLLTYKLVKDLVKSHDEDHDTSTWVIPILQYFIRRFFRVYLVFALFVWAAVYGPDFIAGYTFGMYEEFSQVLLLGYPGPNHLWTIAPEIKFYLVIPFICLVFAWTSVRFAAPGRIGVLALSGLWTVCDQMFNIFQLTRDDVLSYTQNCHLLKNHFAVFFVGSQLALAFYTAEKSEDFINWSRHERVRKIMNYSSLLLSLFGLVYFNDSINKSIDFSYRSRAAILWSLVLFMCLLSVSDLSSSPPSSSNLIVRFFQNCKCLRKCGQFSFGIYLLHPAAIQFVNGFRYIVKLRLAVLGSMCVSFLFGLVLYYALERHLIRLANFLGARLAKHSS